MLDTNIYKELKLQTQMSISSMVLFDQNGVLKKYESALEILKEFYPIRLQFYIKRKKYYEGMLQAEALKLENQARFILEKNDKQIVMENIKKKEFINILIERKYDSDPVKLWKSQNKIEEENTNLEEADAEPQSELEKKYDFDYLIDMTMRTMLRENVQELLKKRDLKKQELDELRQSTPAMLWEKDLDAFLEELEKVEQKEQDDVSKQIKVSKNKKDIKHFGKLGVDLFKPSKNAERIEPKIDYEKYQVKEKKERKKKEDKDRKNEKDDKQIKITALMTAAVAASSTNKDSSTDDEVKLLSKPKQKLKLKQTTINFKSTKGDVINFSDESYDVPKKKNLIVILCSHLLILCNLL